MINKIFAPPNMSSQQSRQAKISQIYSRLVRQGVENHLAVEQANCIVDQDAFDKSDTPGAVASVSKTPTQTTITTIGDDHIDYGN